jgi:hypothetical protein
MPTECTPKRFEFEAVARRAVMACFDGGDITSNAGALLLGQVDRGLGLTRRFAACFTDRRDPRFVEHRVETLVGQRIFGLALGYEDLLDHDELRLCRKPGAAGRQRYRIHVVRLRPHREMVGADRVDDPHEYDRHGAARLLQWPNGPAANSQDDVTCCRSMGGPPT